MTDEEPENPSRYGVGYAKPPKTTQFKPGQSGNTKGRPKGGKNFGTTLDTVLKEKILITENGQKRKITKREAAAKQLVNKGVAGDPRFLPLLLSEIKKRDEDKLQKEQAVPQELDQADQMVLENMLKRLRRPATPAPMPHNPDQKMETDDDTPEKE